MTKMIELKVLPFIFGLVVAIILMPQVKATDISSCDTHLSSMGSYDLINDLTCNIGENGIWVDISDIYLNGNGYTISINSGRGIQLTQNLTNITIENFKIVGINASDDINLASYGNSSNIKISNNILNITDSSGIMLQFNNSNIEISNNIFYIFSYSNGIFDNLITSNCYDGNHNITIKNNVMNIDDLLISSSAITITMYNFTIDNNTIISNGGGIMILADSINLGNEYIINNNISGSVNIAGIFPLTQADWCGGNGFIGTYYVENNYIDFLGSSGNGRCISNTAFPSNEKDTYVINNTCKNSPRRTIRLEDNYGNVTYRILNNNLYNFTQEGITLDNSALPYGIYDIQNNFISSDLPLSQGLVMLYNSNISILSNNYIKSNTNTILSINPINLFSDNILINYSNISIGNFNIITDKTLTRTINNLNNTNIVLNENGLEYTNYIISGLIPNVNYNVYDNSSIKFGKNTSSNGILNFNYNLGSTHNLELIREEPYVYSFQPNETYSYFCINSTSVRNYTANNTSTYVSLYCQFGCSDSNFLSCYDNGEKCNLCNMNPITEDIIIIGGIFGFVILIAFTIYLVRRI